MAQASLSMTMSGAFQSLHRGGLFLALRPSNEPERRIPRKKSQVTFGYDGSERWIPCNQDSIRSPGHGKQTVSWMVCDRRLPSGYDTVVERNPVIVVDRWFIPVIRLSAFPTGA